MQDCADLAFMEKDTQSYQCHHGATVSCENQALLPKSGRQNLQATGSWARAWEWGYANSVWSKTGAKEGMGMSIVLSFLLEGTFLLRTQFVHK